VGTPRSVDHELIVMANVREPASFGREEIRVIVHTPTAREQRLADRANFCSAFERHDTMLRE
jgi:hypothetical protein